jgi:steroid Delta-isomerase
MSSDQVSERSARHVAAFNDCVRSGDWPGFAGRFATDATMRFVGVPAGPFTGREAIAAAYAAQPPTDTLTVTRGASSGDLDELWFTWDGTGEAGSMELRWSGDLIDELTVTFG